MKLHVVDFSHLEEITLTPMGDEHLGSKYYDKDYHEEILEWILYREHNYMIHMGDALETATRDSIGAGIFEQDQMVQEQLESSLELYKPLAEAGKIWGMHIGNHEDRVYKHSGLNLTKTMTNILGTKYFDVGVVHYIKVGNQNYTMYTTHGASGSRLPHTKIKAVIDLSNMIDVEIYCMGHLHQLSHHVRQFYQVDKRSRTVQEQTKHFILTGSYLTHWGSYAQKVSYEMMRKGSPKISLNGKTHEIRVSIG